MRIVAFSHGLAYGGAQVCTLEIAELLRTEGIEIAIAVSEHVNKPFLRDLRDSGIPVYAVPSKTYVARYTDMNVFAVSDLIESSDVVWIADDAYLVAPKIKKIKDIGIVAHLHGSPLICPWWGASYGLREICARKCTLSRIIKCKQLINSYLANWGLQSISRTITYQLLDLIKGPVDFLRWPVRKKYHEIIENVDAFIAVSNAVREMHLKHLPEMFSKHFEVIYNPINVPDLDPSIPLSNTIVYAAGSNILKGSHILMHAMRKVIRELPEVKLLMVGKYDNRFLSLIKKTEVEKNLRFIGYLNRYDVLKIFAEARLVVVPSVRAEGFGRVAAEAIMIGTPVVASKIGGLIEIVDDGITGVLARPSDSDDLAEKIIEALSRKWDRVHIFRMAKKKFDPRKIVKHFLRFIDKIV